MPSRSTGCERCRCLPQILDGLKGFDRAVYGPYFTLLQAEFMAVIAVHGALAVRVLTPNPMQLCICKPGRMECICSATEQIASSLRICVFASASSHLPQVGL